jgi:hypothetical protein
LATIGARTVDHMIRAMPEPIFDVRFWGVKISAEGSAHITGPVLVVAACHLSILKGAGGRRGKGRQTERHTYLPTRASAFW